MSSGAHKCLWKRKIQLHKVIRAMNTSNFKLQDLGNGHHRAKYTWFRGEDSLQVPDLTISPQWNDSYRGIKQFSPQRILSHHRPVLLEWWDWDSNPSYFKFENMLQNVEGFFEKVKERWRGYFIGGSLGIILWKNSEACKMKNIAIWNRDKKLEVQKGKLMNNLAILEHSTEGILIILRKRDHDPLNAGNS